MPSDLRPALTMTKSFLISITVALIIEPCLTCNFEMLCSIKFVKSSPLFFIIFDLSNFSSQYQRPL